MRNHNPVTDEFCHHKRTFVRATPGVDSDLKVNTGQLPLEFQTPCQRLNSLLKKGVAGDGYDNPYMIKAALQRDTFQYYQNTPIADGQQEQFVDAGQIRFPLEQYMHQGEYVAVR